MNHFDIMTPETFFIFLPTVLLCSLFCHLYYSRNRPPILKLWIASWFIHFIRLLLLSTPIAGQIPWIIFQSLAIAGSLLQLFAAHQFVGAKTSRRWYLYALSTLGLNQLMSLYPNGIEYSISFVLLFLCLVYCEIALCLIHYIRTFEPSKNITGLSMLGLGISVLSIPMLFHLEFYVVSIYLDTLLRILIIPYLLSAYFAKSTHALTSQKNFYHQMAGQISDCIYKYILIPSPHISYISPNIALIAGYVPQDFYNNQNLFRSIVHPHDWRLFEDTKHTIETFIKKTASLQNLPFQTFRLIHRNTQIVWIEQSLRPYYDAESNSYGYFAVMRDISAKKQHEIQSRHQNERKLISRMAANLADEIRNPITSIRGYLQYFSAKTEFHKYAETFHLLINELDQSSKKINQYILFGKQDTPSLKQSDLNNIIRELLPAIKQNALQIHEKHVLQLDLETIPDLLLDKNDMKTLIEHLTNNAFESMPAGGTVYISTQQLPAFVVLTIQDEGAGIPSAILENLGQPFLSTKKSKSGLGLSLCYAIVRRNQAKIDIVSTSIGTKVNISFSLASS